MHIKLADFGTAKILVEENSKNDEGSIFYGNIEKVYAKSPMGDSLLVLVHQLINKRCFFTENLRLLSSCSVFCIFYYVLLKSKSVKTC